MYSVPSAVQALLAEPPRPHLYNLTTHTPDDAEWADLPAVQEFSAVPGITVTAVISVSYGPQRAMFDIYKRMIGARVSKSVGGHDANVQTLYHVSRGDIRDIVEYGLDGRIAARGFFGRGIYLSDSILKANDYSAYRGDLAALHTMFRCSVILGRVKDFSDGRFDRDLIVAPEGFHSVAGFIRRSKEYVVYDNNQTIIEDIVIYRDSVVRSSGILPLPSPKHVFITASLSEYISKLEKLFPDAKLPDFKMAVAKLIRCTMPPSEFVSTISGWLKRPAPADLVAKLESELAKCQLHVATSGLAAAASQSQEAPAVQASALP